MEDSRDRRRCRRSRSTGVLEVQHHRRHRRARHRRNLRQRRLSEVRSTSTLGLAGRGVATITQQGSPDLAAVIEGDPSRTVTLHDQVALDVRRLVENHRSSRSGREIKPLSKIVLGCTHFPLVEKKIDDAFSALSKDPGLAPYIAPERHYIDPAEWTARQLFQELASAKLRRRDSPADGERNLFFLSVANPVGSDPTGSDGRLNPDGSLTDAYKYSRDPSQFIEDTLVVPMTRTILPEAGRKLVSEKLPAVWGRLGNGK
jgi:hypothetical protein